MTNTPSPTPSTQARTEKQGIISLALWFFLGYLGAHHFYAGRVMSGIAMLALVVIGAFTAVILIGIVFLLIAFVWWVIDGIKIIVSLGKAGREGTS